MVKAILTLVYEEDISGDDEEVKLQKDFLKQAVKDMDEQALSEVFGIGWESPVKCRVKFEE